MPAWMQNLRRLFATNPAMVVMNHTEKKPVTIIPTMPDNILLIAKQCLGQRQTLNDTVPSEVGCAEAVSTVLHRAGVEGIPATGIASTLNLYNWLKNNPKFEQITAPEPGAVVVSPTGMGNGKVRGHTGIVGRFNVAFRGDYGICSNDSNSGLFLELWQMSKWDQYYGGYGGLPIFYFRAL